MWNVNSRIRVKFLNGDSYLQDKVIKYAVTWAFYCNIPFLFVAPNEEAEIKVAFKWNGDTGSWSHIGTSCLQVAQNQPSINFGWFDHTTPEEEFSRVVTHEFGHALGLLHEHNHPFNTILWSNSAPSYLTYKEDPNESYYNAYDEYSIMHYPIEKTWTTNQREIPWICYLSPLDKEFIQQLYPSSTYYLFRYDLTSINKHLYTNNFSELGYNNYNSVMGKIHKSQVSGTTPIYRYYNVINKDMLITIWRDELQGGNSIWNYQAILGYAYPNQVPGTIPVYRYYRSSPEPSHFFTTNYNELGQGLNGYHLEGIAFYIM